MPPEFFIAGVMPGMVIMMVAKKHYWQSDRERKDFFGRIFNSVYCRVNDIIIMMSVMRGLRSWRRRRGRIRDWRRVWIYKGSRIWGRQWSRGNWLNHLG